MTAIYLCFFWVQLVRFYFWSVQESVPSVPLSSNEVSKKKNIFDILGTMTFLFFIHENPAESIKIQWNPLESIRIHENPSKSMKIPDLMSSLNPENRSPQRTEARNELKPAPGTGSVRIRWTEPPRPCREIITENYKSDTCISVHVPLHIYVYLFI